jgi:hypothetical protein
MQLPRIALATLGRLFGPSHPGVRTVAPGAPLCRSGLIEVEPEGPWATRMASAAARVAWALSGDDSMDPGLPTGAAVARAPTGPQAAEPPADLVMAVGRDRATRIAAAMRRSTGSRFLVTPIPDSSRAWDAVVREATVAGLAVVIEVAGELPAEARRRIEGADHLAWAVASPSEIPLEHIPDRTWIEVRADDGRADKVDWRRLTGRKETPPHRIAREQLRLVELAAPALNGDIDAAIRRLASGHLDGMASRIRPSRNWTDLVLPHDQLEQLREIVARYRHGNRVRDDWGMSATPGGGLVALLSGPSGTGKTLAAEVIAGALDLDLYKVDLSSVVSKYIGETEKNLERVFSGAAAGNLVLFFDEADALFGRRSEVGDAHDRYANIEVAYLLQRLEAYEGVVIMATNLQRNMDPAFLRRVHVAVEFPMPDQDDRLAIWELSLPPSAPVQNVDHQFLARQFRISGGAIRNAALTAAFLAAEAGTRITMETVILALKREFQKLGRLRTEAEFDRYFELVRGEADAAPVG